MPIIEVLKPSAPVAKVPGTDPDHWIVSLRESQLKEVAKVCREGKLPSKYVDLGQEMLTVYYAFSGLPADVQRKALAALDQAKVPKNCSKK